MREPPTQFLRYADRASKNLLTLLFFLITALMLIGRISNPCPCEVVPEGTEWTVIAEYQGEPVRMPTNYWPRTNNTLVTQAEYDSLRSPYRNAEILLWIGVPLVILIKSRLPWVRARNRERLEKLREEVKNIFSKGGLFDR